MTQHPDPQWRERLETIQRDFAERSVAIKDKPLGAFRVARNRIGSKPKGQLIPEVHTSHISEVSRQLPPAAVAKADMLSSIRRRWRRLRMPIALLQNSILSSCRITS